MSELSFEQMLEDSFKTIHNGEVVDGTVIDVKPDEIILSAIPVLPCSIQPILTAYRASKWYPAVLTF